ncbi:hypothetical protein A3D05_05740 [Candidatus Gottesmanbacteria bacterium RIFCSPHIGHO2_02_FULL_40_24]|uniref:histidine kinase n=1 Tax=Candidatus Gottesmanbacteria bacterium RIFCSPHIGHO2_01_FULL_40_15 TaxID=1798376 RepID=A0A1F5Z6Y4_9BACT|nr:MAG: hypothetical protein A2777_02375 [Candidatus Gottesmanbacteria bacterium RIFCSPHIGHO2_01_FULL_40_15]OGG16530.1 MAG: hypothetical protein A3D05_05740 [Candidatus Gottesmanbacteria bacterium RIFCSPHIGHO2_02_FULL_40_24]OGG25643.1 MAG: hypothetical protein A3E42_04890 [Candidatus Gottesmanbacteria bacterium RIFCSPHIGHO2_12_FULL_40_13]OGG32646.1 MAG: hypothetical protein A3I80_06385 [Candidatus Gottesmanbacteria bacterium RIFCSPLOWO2_02_FULL_40_10]
MSYKYRLFIFTFLISFIPLLIISLYSYNSLRVELVKNNISRLEVVADTAKERINIALDQYLDQAELVTHRLQLGSYINNFLESENEESFEGIEDILSKLSINELNFNSAEIYNLDGKHITSTGQGENQFNINADKIQAGGDKFQLNNIFTDKNGQLQVSIWGPLFFENKKVGYIEYTANSHLFTNITDDYFLLGDTGEITLLKNTQAGDAIFLTPLRFDKNAALTRTVPKDTENATSLATIKKLEETLIEEDLVDYRGKPVFAVTRYIEPLDWSLVAKIDQEEVFSSGTTLLLAFAAVFLTTLIILMTGVLVFTRLMTKPINELTKIAQRLRQRDFSARASEIVSGELGILSKTFNEMAHELQEIYSNLDQKVKERTRKIESIEAEKEAMLSNIGEGVLATDNKGRLLFINRAAKKILGLTEGKFTGKPLTRIVKMLSGEEKPISEHNRPMNKVLQTGKPYSVTSINNNYYYLNSKGEKIPIAFVVTPINLDNRIIGSIEVFRDIMKEKEVDKAKTEFVSLASHQLRTPLTMISWYTEMLLTGDAGKISKEQKNYLREIYNGNKRMTDLVNALLNVSRLDLGTIAINPEPTDILKLMTEVLAELKPTIEKNKLSIKEKHEKIPAIHLDPRLMRIIYQNLISNAVKYTGKEGKIEINHTIMKKGEMADKNHRINTESVLITVSDNGWGIPKKQQEKIFTKLFRADNAKLKDSSGTGLGLYIVKSVIEQFNGSVWFESEENKGTKFFVIIPASGIKKKKGSKNLN